MDKLVHICEVCGTTETLTPEEAYRAGWDYPPTMAPFGIVAPHTCPKCLMKDTVWWKLAVERISTDDLTEHDREVIDRIAHEPASVLSPGEQLQESDGHARYARRPKKRNARP